MASDSDEARAGLVANALESDHAIDDAASKGKDPVPGCVMGLIFLAMIVWIWFQTCTGFVIHP